uniref:Uncharacterized protein n=1 Tax=Tanacetum cinerariifolium TaxID=118510 RepID=A0A6L2MM27_TANCI|nr:hypothetical protein [Tanacetum cinerariifolium]
MSLESFQAPVNGVAIHEPALSVTRSLPVVKVKGKGIATDEHAAQSLLKLQQPKKKSTTNQYIFQRRTPVTEEASTGPSTQPHDDTSANVIRDTPSHTDAKTGANTEKSNSEGDNEILIVDEERDPGNTLESRFLLDENQDRLNPGQSHVALAGPNPKPMHKDFIATVYPKVHKILKHTTKEHVFLENPPSSSRTLSSMKNLDEAFTFGDQFINDKPTKEEPGKANVESEVESMVSVPIHQAFSSTPPLSTPIIDLTTPKPISPPAQEPKICSNFKKKHKPHDKTTQALSSRVFTLENHDLYSKIDNYVNETVKEAVQNALQAPVHERFRELSEFKMKEILCDRMFKNGSYRSQPKHGALHDALEASMDHENREYFIEVTTKLRGHRCCHLLKIKTRLDWLKPLSKEERPKTPELDWAVPPNDLPKTENNWANEIVNAYKDLEENKLIWKTGDIGSFIKWYCKQIGKSKLSKDDLEANPEGHRVMLDVSNPLPLRGPPGQVTIQPQYFFNKDLEYLLSGDKDRRNALSISKLKAAYYLDFGLEQVPSVWIESEHEYNISTVYGILHWWFKRKEFYVTRHSAPSDRHAVRSHMKILNVVSLNTFSRYGYTYLKEIVLRRADYKEYKI